ncbi:hypothetical protein BEWA_027270 [Theileria equi strain WA]|uniref:Uncharacterized protein n=1 Tax=Theileria equi strain WA TaxID=1537102 RepID=L0AXB7_THEEQ|nr:hypothetical protein BEWA_027270 [Theileria equi strain WA]AFZ79878.1 hypothetical protein BEWA_027270 [Theileria equi strain WA]|eukprot:XP_004829544.1 hypothetical protein BEWA_027270 [Theileria equi strain WA]
MGVSAKCKDWLKKAALFFAGLGHLQPMLLAATNSDYLLDRFLLEKRCSSEYVSRMITSLIFIEISATILMGTFGVLLGLYKFIPEEKEEDFRGYLSCVIQWILLFGHAQIVRAFTSGGEKGDIQWFYYSLLFQHFFTCIIGAGIGFIDVDRALWYLMNIPVLPVIIFFYQMWIHMWARKKGLVNIGYMVVENQIRLGVINSCITTLLWTIAYSGLLEAEDEGVTIKLSENKKAKNGGPHTYQGSTIGGGRTITVTRTPEQSNFFKYTHENSSWWSENIRFTVKEVKHGNTPLILHPCINGPVDEVAVYYEGACSTENPLLICVRSDNSYGYYCKGNVTYCKSLGHVSNSHDNCWYRYKNGDRRSKIEPESGTDQGLGNLLEQLKCKPHQLTSKNFSSVATADLQNLQSDHKNYDYRKILWDPCTWYPSPTCMPLIMHGLAVGAMGSIYPHLVPKTLVSAKHARIFDILSMFLAAIVQILNLIFFEYKSPAFANRPWEGEDKWYLTWLFYVPYLLSFLLIIFNIHYPGWRICCYIRSHTWFAFLIMLSVSFINDIFLAVGRGGIMDQRSGNKGIDGRYLKNDHSLFNKMAPFMALSFIPFWLTTSPMIKSYARSVDQYLSDKDRDSWPTSRYGFWSLSVSQSSSRLFKRLLWSITTMATGRSLYSRVCLLR